MASKAWDDMLSGVSPYQGAFQYGGAVRPERSSYETATAYDQRNQGQQEMRDIHNMRYRNEQTAFNNQQGMLKNLFNSGGGAAPGGPSADNRFASGLTDAESRLRALLDNPDSINQSGAYKFRVKQGEEALQRQMGARGMLNSGNRLMELTKYGQDMGSQEYDNQYGRLAGLLGTYGQGYIGDKNANTSIYSAQQTAKANDQRNNLSAASLAWDMNKPQVGGRSGGGGTISNLYSAGPSPASVIGDNLQNDILSEKLRQVRGY